DRNDSGAHRVAHLADPVEGDPEAPRPHGRSARGRRMSAPASEKKGWFTGLIDGAARAFAFGGGAATQPAERIPEQARRKIDVKGLTLQVQRLVASGHTPADIARRTALSQDT